MLMMPQYAHRRSHSCEAQQLSAMLLAQRPLIFSIQAMGHTVVNYWRASIAQEFLQSWHQLYHAYHALRIVIRHWDVVGSDCVYGMGHK
jgi:hypothetical protein